MENIINIIGKEELDKNIKEAEGLVILDFWADWCAPCKRIAPILEEIANDTDNVNLLKIEVDIPENQGLSTDYRVRGIPALFFIKDGEIIDKASGAQSKESIENIIKKNK